MAKNVPRYAVIGEHTTEPMQADEVGDLEEAKAIADAYVAEHPKDRRAWVIDRESDKPRPTIVYTAGK